MNGNTIGSARVVLGAVAPVPWRSDDAERSLVGKPLDEATAVAAGDAAVRAAKPLSRNGYKVQIAKTAVKRAILQAAGMKIA
jgi:xanthine dehydrogenase YagS FAD-binding subunit